MTVAIVCSAHGFGHVARQLALAEALRARGVEPALFTAAPAAVVRGYLPGADLRPWTVDVGIAQADSLREDIPETRRRLETVCSDAAIDRLAARLAGFDRVVVDCAPAALAACRRAGVAALAVGNFDWAWIYRRYPRLADWAETFAAWQAPHPAIALSPGPGMQGFARVEPGGLLGRRRPARRVVGPGERAVLVSFGGLGLADVHAWLPRLPGVVYVLSPPMVAPDRPDCLYIDGVPYPALVAGADAVFTKPGYGIFAEAALAGTPIVWVDRGAFPEAPSLEAAMRARGDQKVGAGGLAAALESLWTRRRPAPVDGAVEALATYVCGQIA